jgi:hypothetical protein
MNRETALKWLYGQLRRKRIALGRAEKKPNADAVEIGNLQESIEIIEWIIGKVLEGGEDAEENSI